MQNKYIFFRTDRIGDFLLSAIMIKAIKRSDKISFITVVASKKNYSYLKNFNFIDEVILFPDSYFSKFIFYLKFFFKKFYLIAILDGKKRSLYFSLLNRSKFKFLFTFKKSYSIIFKYFFTKIFYDNECENKISEIKIFLNFLDFDLIEDDLKTIEKSVVLSRDFKIPTIQSYNLLHFDEKWIFNDYIQSYKSIEPVSEKLLIVFIEQLILKTNNDVFISTGRLPNKFTDFLKAKFLSAGTDIYELKAFNNKIVFFDNMNFLELERLILSSSLLITCHGAPTHVAAAFGVKIIDIIDNSEKVFFDKWTSHFNNYTCLERDSFEFLSDKIILNS